MNNLFFKYLILSFLFIFILLGVSGYYFYSHSYLITKNPYVTISASGFVWPSPKYHQITSPFGYRKSPFTGKTSYHSGIDIGAPQGSDILSAFSGTVTFIGFSGANGYTVRVSNEMFEANYSHVSPYFLVYIGQYVSAGDLIAVVGPKNVYDVPNNPYKDSNGNPTNGSTTGPHLHFSLKKDR